MKVNRGFKGSTILKHASPRHSSRSIWNRIDNYKFNWQITNFSETKIAKLQRVCTYIYGVVRSARNKLTWVRTLGKENDFNVSGLITSQRFWNFASGRDCWTKIGSFFPAPAMAPPPFLSPARFLERHLVSLTFVPRLVFRPFNSVPPIVNRVPALTERCTRAPVPLNLHAVFMNSSSAFRHSLIILNSEFEMYEMEREIMRRRKKE